MAAPAGNVNSEVAKLFARLTVDEVTEREAQLRVDIERKQVQLRRLVSDRYRDLVGSVEVLKRMQQESRRVAGHIERARGVRGRDEQKGREGGGDEWALACAARQLLQVEAAAWHEAGLRQWREAGARVREGMARLEEWRPQLAARVPVVLAGPLGDGRLLRQIVGEAKKRLAAPEVLGAAEKESLCACVGEEGCLLEGRVSAFEMALLDADTNLALCCALVEESATLPDYLARASALAEARPPPVRDLAATAARLGRVAEGPWEGVLGPPLLRAMRAAASTQLRALLSSCSGAEEAAEALRQWSAAGLAGLGQQGWARQLRAFALECGKEALAGLAARWEEEARKTWGLGGEGREEAALHCALRLQALERVALLPLLSTSVSSSASSSSSSSSVPAPLSRVAREALARAQQQQQQGAPRASDLWLVGWAHCAIQRLPLPLPTYSKHSLAPSHPSTAVVSAVFSACGTLLRCPSPPSWIPALVAQLLSLRLAAALEPLTAVFSAQLHLDLLFLDAALATASASPAAAAAAVSLGLPDLSSGGGGGRPFLRMAAALAGRADPIDGAYSQLHAPGLAAQAVARSAALLQPLLSSSSSPAASPASDPDIFSLARPARVAYPFRSLPLASRRVLVSGGIVVPDDDEEQTVVARQPSSSLFQRLGSQLW